MKPVKSICLFILVCFSIKVAAAGQPDKNESDIPLTPSSYYDRGLTCLAGKNTKGAIADFSQALYLADSVKNVELMLRVMESLSQAYVQSGEDDNALLYTKKYYLLKDSIANTIRVRMLEDLKMQHAETIKALERNVAEKDERIVRGETENKNLFNYFILINGLLALVMVVLILVFVASGRKSKKLVKEYERMLAEEKEAAGAAEIKNHETLEKIGKKFNRHIYRQHSFIRLLTGNQTGQLQLFLDGIRHANEKMLELGSLFHHAGDRVSIPAITANAHDGKKYEGAVSVLIFAEDEHDGLVLSGSIQKYFTGAAMQIISNVTAINDGNFDVLVFDGWRPDQNMDGLMERMDELISRFPDASFILVSDDETIIHACKGKAAALLSKPLNDDELVSAIFRCSKKQFNAVSEKAEPVKEEWKDENFQQLFFKQLPQKLQVIEEAVKRGDWRTIRQRILEVRTMLAFTGMELTDPVFNEFEKMDGSTSFMTWHNRTTAFCKRVREKIAALEDAAASG